MTARAKDPLAPLEWGVRVVLGAMVALTVAVLVGVVGNVGSDPLGDREACVTTAPGRGTGFGGDGRQGDHPLGLGEGVRWHPSTIDICDTHPRASSVALGVTRDALPVVGGLVVLWWLLRLLTRARRTGLFADRIPRQLERLGGFLLAWTALTWMSAGFIDAVLMNRMVPDADLVLFQSADVPVVTVLVALGLVTLGRVMAYGVALREDSEATI